MILKSFNRVELAILNDAKCVIGAATPSSRRELKKRREARRLHHQLSASLRLNMTRLSGLAVWIESPGNTSKELDKNVVVRV